MPVTTVLGPVEGHALGRVDAHEHLFLRSPVLPGEDFHDVDRMVEEGLAVRASGIDTVVDLTPIGLGRKPTATAELSRRTGLNVVLATGIHRKAHYPAGHWVHVLGVDELAELMVTDIQTGIDERDWQGPRPVTTEICAGIIKLGASYHVVQDVERRWFRAGALAAMRTGVPVAVHAEVGTAAHDILDLLEQGGVPPRRVMVAPRPQPRPEVARRDRRPGRVPRLRHDWPDEVPLRRGGAPPHQRGRVARARVTDPSGHRRGSPDDAARVCRWSRHGCPRPHLRPPAASRARRGRRAGHPGRQPAPLPGRMRRPVDSRSPRGSDAVVARATVTSDARKVGQAGSRSRAVRATATTSRPPSAARVSASRHGAAPAQVRRCAPAKPSSAPG